MPEAIAALAGSVLHSPGIDRVQATCDTENIGSQRALEKSGFRCEGRLERHMVHPNISPEPRARVHPRPLQVAAGLPRAANRAPRRAAAAALAFRLGRSPQPRRIAGWPVDAGLLDRHVDFMRRQQHGRLAGGRARAFTLMASAAAAALSGSPPMIKTLRSPKV